MSSKELVISQNRHETKVAILEDGQLVEMFFQRANEYSLAGSIHKGRVTRVLPGMQSAFVDVGLERDCFLYVSDFFEENADEIDRVDDKGRDQRGRDRDRGREREAAHLPLPPPASQAAMRGEDVPVESVAPAGEARDASAEPAAPAEGTAYAEGQRDARGRRSRRRRRGGKGFPESKYASPTAAPEAPAEDEPEQEPAAAAAPAVDEILLLPGESLAKYRRAGRPVETAATASRVEPRESPEPRESAAPAEIDAPESEAESEDFEAGEDEAVEAILDRVDEMEERADAAADEDIAAESASDKLEESDRPGEEEAPGEPAGQEANAGSATLTPGPAVSAHAVPAEAAPAAAGAVEASAEEPVAAEPLAPGVPAEDQAVPDEVAASAEPGTGAEAAGGEAGEDERTEDGPEGAPETGAENLAANLRPQGGRIGHRMSRRMRRRARQSGQSPAPVAEAPAEVRAEVETPAPVAVSPEPERVIERPDRNNRERDSREQDGRERDSREQDSRDRNGRERDSREQDSRERDDGRERPPLPSISDLLKEGQEIIVQIAKEPLGQKGARITSHIALPGRYVVYMPTVEHLGVSRKIGSDEERLRLKRILQKHREGIAGGYIMRTAGEGRTEEEIAADMQYLATLWLDIRAKAEKRRAPLLLHHDVEVVQRLLRDQLTDGFKAVWVDNEDLYEQVLHAVERIAPHLLSRVKMYTRPEPIFDAFAITQELEKALRPKVWLKSGGYIVINQTEALVAIDVNTGKYVGKSNRLEDTIVKTNVEAVKEIVRQVRLRDLGGIIVVDFIDMDERKNRQRVMLALEETMRSDKAPNKILQFNDFGLVAITRKRVKQSLERALCSPCPYCEASGYVKSVATVISEILAQAQKYAKVVDGKECVLRVNPAIAHELQSTETKYLEEIEEILGRPVLVISDNLLHQEKFDLT
jgi:ribonuclease G